MNSIFKTVSFVLFLFTSCNNSVSVNADMDTEAISEVLNNWHKAASDANFNLYFDVMADSSVFIGTDATENWDKKEFMDFAKPYFDKGKAWSFSVLDRNIYLNKTANIAWFDELLNTQMKICRGSGVMEKIGPQWKIKHYVLSMTIPNEQIDSIVGMKATIEDSIILKYNQKRNN